MMQLRLYMYVAVESLDQCKRIMEGFHVFRPLYPVDFRVFCGFFLLLLFFFFLSVGM